MSEGTPLIQPKGSGAIAAHREAPGIIEERSYERSEKDWEYWQHLLQPAVDYSKACITPEMTPEAKQAILKDTLKTFEEWLRQEP